MFDVERRQDLRLCAAQAVARIDAALPERNEGQNGAPERAPVGEKPVVARAENMVPRRPRFEVAHPSERGNRAWDYDDEFATASDELTAGIVARCNVHRLRITSGDERR